MNFKLNINVCYVTAGGAYKLSQYNFVMLLFFAGVYIKINSIPSIN